MAVPSHRFQCAGTNRTWLLGSAIVLYLFGLVAEVELMLTIYAKIGMFRDMDFSGKFSSSYTFSNTDIAIPVFGGLGVLAKGCLASLASYAETKKNPKRLTLMLIFAYLSLFFEVVYQTLSMIVGDKGILLGIDIIVVQFILTCILFAAANRRYQELMDFTQNRTREEGTQTQLGSV